MACEGGGNIRNGSTAQMLPVPKMMTAGMLEMTGYDNEQPVALLLWGYSNTFYLVTPVTWKNEAQSG